VEIYNILENRQGRAMKLAAAHVVSSTGYGKENLDNTSGDRTYPGIWKKRRFRKKRVESVHVMGDRYATVKGSA